jgi:hypothetical protein
LSGNGIVFAKVELRDSVGDVALSIDDVCDNDGFGAELACLIEKDSKPLLFDMVVKMASAGGIGPGPLAFLFW